MMECCLISVSLYLFVEIYAANVLYVYTGFFCVIGNFSGAKNDEKTVGSLRTNFVPEYNYIVSMRAYLERCNILM